MRFLLPLPEGSTALPPQDGPSGAVLSVLVPPPGDGTGATALVVADRPLPRPPRDGVPPLAGLHAWLVRRTSTAGQVEVVPTPFGPAAAAVDVREVDGTGPVTTAEAALPLGDRLVVLSASAPGVQPAQVARLVATALAGLRAEPARGP